MSLRQAARRSVFSTLLLGLISGAVAAAADAAANPAPASFTILHVNDVYRIEGLEQGARGGFARLRTLRRELESGGVRF